MIGWRPCEPAARARSLRVRLTISVRAATPADAAGVAAVLEASYPRLMAAAYAPELLGPPSR